MMMMMMMMIMMNKKKKMTMIDDGHDGDGIFTRSKLLIFQGSASSTSDGFACKIASYFLYMRSSLCRRSLSACTTFAYQGLSL